MAHRAIDEYAIYDCNYWDYAEVGKGRVVLTKDGLRKDIQLKKNANEASDTIDTFLVVDERIRNFE